MFKVLTKGCEPTKGSKYSAGIDLYASEDVIIGAGETKIIGLGVCINLDWLHDNVDEWCGHNGKIFVVKNNPNDYEKFTNKMHYKNFEWYMSHHYLELHPRSSLRAKGLISNTGIIDLDYEDEIKIIIHNPYTESIYKVNDRKFKIKKGYKIAQILLKEHKGYLFGVESDEKRVGGFGSTK